MPDEAAPPAAADRAAFPLVTLAEAAAELGRPKEALRAMIRRGKLRAIRGNSGQYMIELSPDLREPRGQPRRDHAVDSDQAPAENQEVVPDRVAGRAAELEDAIEEWRLAAEEGRLAAAVAAAKLEAAERAHAAEVLAREVVIADLRMALAEARRPFWRRWLG